MNREKTQYAKHVELSVHNVVSAKLGKSSTLRDGTQARELFIVTRDGETVTVNLFAKSDISVRSAREKFPSISTRDLRSGKLIEVMLHDRGIE